MAASSQEVARSINSLMRLSPADQGSLLEVIEDYFSYPSPSISSVHDPEEFSDDDDGDVDDMEMESGTLCMCIIQYKRV